MNKTQIKKIQTAKTWFIESEKFTLDHRVLSMFDGRAKNMLIDAYEFLLTSFKKDSKFQDIIKLYEAKNFEEKQDYVDLVLAIKKFIINN